LRAASGSAPISPCPGAYALKGADMATMAPDRESLLLELGKVRSEATRLCDIAEEAFSAVAALEQFVLSVRFSVDSVALGDLAPEIQQHMDKIADERKNVDKYNLLEVLRSSEEFFNVVEKAIRREREESDGD
jgi:hypothetical protein